MGAEDEAGTMTKRRGARKIGRRALREVRRQDLEPARKRLGLTQLEIAERLGVHVRTWGKWIGGERVCPWSVWLAIQGMKPGGKGEGRGPGRPKSKALKKGA